MLDFTVTAAELGKPAGADLKLGLATAPVLFAWDEYPELEALIKRKFSKKGDEERVSYFIFQISAYSREKKKKYLFLIFFFRFYY